MNLSPGQHFNLSICTFQSVLSYTDSLEQGCILFIVVKNDVSSVKKRTFYEQSCIQTRLLCKYSLFFKHEHLINNIGHRGRNVLVCIKEETKPGQKHLRIKVHSKADVVLLFKLYCTLLTPLAAWETGPGDRSLCQTPSSHNPSHPTPPTNPLTITHLTPITPPPFHFKSLPVRVRLSDPEDRELERSRSTGVAESNIFVIPNAVCL